MGKFDSRDLLCGILIAASGVFFALYSMTNYQLGTIGRMGSGMFPLGVGIVIAILGVLIMIPAFLRTGVLPPIEFRAPIAILVGIAAFALAVVPFGLLPAVVVLTAISSVADKETRLTTILMLSAFLCVLAYLVFRVGLNFALPLFAWPF